MSYATLAEDNQFKFKCPIFNAETKMSSCVKLRHMVWKGLRPEKRRGCQACMAAGKCPAAQIVQKMSMSSSPVADDYGATQPIVGKLRKDVLERIRPVMVMNSTIQLFSPSTAELSLIETANQRIEAMIGTAPGASAPSRSTMTGSARKPRKVASPKAAEPKTTTTDTRIEKAAATGDLGAAL